MKRQNKIVIVYQTHQVFCTNSCYHFFTCVDPAPVGNYAKVYYSDAEISTSEIQKYSLFRLFFASCKNYKSESYFITLKLLPKFHRIICTPSLVYFSEHFQCEKKRSFHYVFINKNIHHDHDNCLPGHHTKASS